MVVSLYEKIFYNKGLLFQYIASISGAISIMSSGINLGWTSPYLPKLLSNSSTIPTTTDQGSWCAIAPLLGSPFGAALAAFLADSIGRKYTTLLMAPIVGFCFIGIAFADSIWLLTAIRFIIGATEGASYTALPMYIGEISDPNIRGFLTSTIAIFAITGTLFINIIGSFMDIFSSSLICAIIPFAHMVTFSTMPESPYYYIKKNRQREARNSLKILRGKANVDDEMETLCKAVVRQELSRKSSILDIFTVPSNRKACCIFLILCLTNKFSGKNPCLFYTEMIFREAGSSIDATLSVIMYCSVELIAVTITTFFIVDRFGKRLLFITSTTGCAVSVFALSLHFYLKDYNYDIIEVLDWLPITALLSYNIFFSIGLSYGMVLILSELFPTSVKANALCIADSFSVMMGALASKFFQITIDNFGTMSIPFFAFSICCAIGLFFVVKCVPETTGKTLEEIQYYLIGKDLDTVMNRK